MIPKSESLPIFAETLSLKINELAETSNVKSLPAFVPLSHNKSPVIVSADNEPTDVMLVCAAVCNVPVKLPEKLVAVTVPPLKVNVDASSSSPSVPATTTLPEVKSEILAEEATKPAPPAILAPPLASIASVNVLTPALTINPPEVILTPVLAVISPTESTLVLSSLVNVPPTVTFPVKVAPPTIAKVDPSKVIELLSSNEPAVPASTTLLFVKSETVAELKVVSAPEKFAPALPSTNPAKVDTPDTLN